MNNDLSQRRLILWNRFWLVLVALYALVGGYSYLEHRILSDVSRLQLRWNDVEAIKSERALTFSTNQGGPFIVTHLATQTGNSGVDTAIAAIAELPHPLFVRGPKGLTYISGHELAGLKWMDAGGRKAAAPKPGASIQALYYETQKVTADK